MIESFSRFLWWNAAKNGRSVKNLSIAYRRASKKDYEERKVHQKETKNILNVIDKNRLRLRKKTNSEMITFQVDKRQALLSLMATMKRPELLLSTNIPAALRPKQQVCFYETNFAKELKEEDLTLDDHPVICKMLLIWKSFNYVRKPIYIDLSRKRQIQDFERWRSFRFSSKRAQKANC